MVYKPKRLHTSMLNSILKSIGLSNAEHHLHNEIMKMISNNGEEWTVARLKHMKVLFIQLLTDQEPTWKWVAHRGGLPKGAFRSIFRYGLKHKDNPGRLAKVLSVLNYATSFVSPKLTNTQKKGLIEHINGQPLWEDYGYVQRLASQLESRAKGFSRLFQKNYHEEFSFAGWTTSKAFMPGRISKTSHPWVASFLTDCIAPSPVANILRDMGIPNVNSHTDPLIRPVGNISVIQERGYKARVIAVPSAGVQVAFRPLHKALDKILKSLQTDCTHDQLSGAHWAKDKLASGCKMFSIDLSSATDNFPLELQLAVLKGLGYTRVSEFTRVCRSPWQTHFGEVLSYTKGQPMGLYGSFSLFGLTHNLLVKHLGADKDEYRIVGDDLIISNETVAKKYLQVMRMIGVPISHHKCIMDTLYAEFAGFLVTPNSVIKPVKFPNSLVDPYAYVHIVKTLGREVPSIVPKKFQKFASVIARLPEEFGGAGYNPEGKSRLERVSGFSTSLELPKIPAFLGPNTVLLSSKFNFVSLVPGSQQIVESLVFQAKLQIKKIHDQLPPVLRAISEIDPERLTVGILSQVSDNIGVLGYATATRQSDVVTKWQHTMISKEIKPSWVEG